MKRREFLQQAALAALGTVAAGSGIARTLNLLTDNESKTAKMKIVVLTGSPRKNGNSAYLAEQFIKGAEEKGHEVFRVVPATVAAWTDLACSTMTFRNSVRT